MPAKIVCVNGSHTGKVVVLEGVEETSLQLGKSDQEQELLFTFEGECWHVASELPFKVNGVETQACILGDGDTLQCGSSAFRFDADEIISVDYNAETHEESEDIEHEEMGEGGRQRRRISASHQAVLTSPENQKKGLLGRVGQAFRRRDERLEHLEELEEQRRKLLVAAGRFALEHQGGLGLPREFLVRIFKGEHIDLGYENLTKSHIDKFRSLRDRLLFIDADIDACRIEMGLPAENRNTLEQLHLRADHEKEEEQAFQAMDVVATVENEFDVNSASEHVDIGSDEHDDATDQAEDPPDDEGDDRTDIIHRGDTDAADPPAADDRQGGRSSARSSGPRRRSVQRNRRRRTR